MNYPIASMMFINKRYKGELELDKNEEVLEKDDSQIDSSSDVVMDETEVVSELDTLKTKLEETEDRMLRLQAELANIQKRNTKERQDAAKYRSQSLAQDLLPVLDSMERAMEIEVDDEKALNLKKGIEMVLTLFNDAFAKEGIEVLNPIDEPFNPNFHQSIQVMPAAEGQAPDTVVAVVQKGYTLKDRVLRPAMVVVTQ